jgi:hypothetical protein
MTSLVCTMVCGADWQISLPKLQIAWISGKMHLSIIN